MKIKEWLKTTLKLSALLGFLIYEMVLASAVAIAYVEGNGAWEFVLGYVTMMFMVGFYFNFIKVYIHKHITPLFQKTG